MRRVSGWVHVPNQGASCEVSICAHPRAAVGRAVAEMAQDRQGAAQRKRASSSGSPLSSQSSGKRVASSVADLSAVPASALAGDQDGVGNIGLEV